mmetsp:Transcript_11771/g.19615  ORF Transcript_11771/g.19615 Transcript_11771/m.19615 type:complete len:218 (+) Transcript_11771:1504-2157(+)
MSAQWQFVGHLVSGNHHLYGAFAVQLFDDATLGSRQRLVIERHAEAQRLAQRAHFDVFQVRLEHLRRTVQERTLGGQLRGGVSAGIGSGSSSGGGVGKRDEVARQRTRRATVRHEHEHRVLTGVGAHGTHRWLGHGEQHGVVRRRVKALQRHFERRRTHRRMKVEAGARRRSDPLAHCARIGQRRRQANDARRAFSLRCHIARTTHNHFQRWSFRTT